MIADGVRFSTWMLTLLLCSSCGGSSSETPPPLEPDPKRLTAPAEAPPAEESAPAAIPPSPGSNSVNVEDGAEFGIEPAGARGAPANGAATPPTWGGTPSSPPAKGKRPPPHAP